jgi:hypothetical protein
MSKNLESESELVTHLTSGDKFSILITKAGGLTARKQYQDWLEVAINLGLQEELFNGVKLLQLKQELEDVKRETEETSPRTPEVTTGDSEPKEGSGSTIATLLKNKRNSGDKP